MDDFQSKLTHELSIKYTFETFDFKGQSPEDLLKAYQDTSSRISKVIDAQNTKAVNESIETMSKLNY